MTRVLFDKVLGYQLLNELHPCLDAVVQFIPWDGKEDLAQKCAEHSPEVVVFSESSAEHVVKFEALKLPQLTMLHCAPSDFRMQAPHPFGFNDVFSSIEHADDLFFRICLLTHKSYKQHLKSPVTLKIVLENQTSFDASFIATSEHGACTTTSEELPLEPAALICTQSNQTFTDLISQIKWSHPGPTNNFFSGLDFIHVPGETRRFLKELKTYSLLNEIQTKDDVWIDVHGNFAELEHLKTLEMAISGKKNVHFYLSQFDSSCDKSLTLWKQFVESIDANIYFHRCNPLSVEVINQSFDTSRSIQIVSQIRSFVCGQCHRRSVRLIDMPSGNTLAGQSEVLLSLIRCVSCQGAIAPAPYISERI